MSEEKKQSNNHDAVIGNSIFIDGTIRGDQDLVVYGEVEGMIHLTDARVNVAEGGNVVADIAAREIEVNGTVQGELRATDTVKIHKSGKLTGNIRSPRVILGDGCQFKGNVDMDYKADQSSERARIPLPKSISSGSRPGSAATEPRDNPVESKLESKLEPKLEPEVAKPAKPEPGKPLPPLSRLKPKKSSLIK